MSNCPRCKIELKAGTYADKKSMLCPALHGVMIKQKHLTKVLQQLLPDLASMVDINSPIKKVPDHSPIGRCPECKGRTEHYGYMESDTAMIDFCPKCNWIWMDSNELETITKMYAQFQKSKPYLDQKYAPRNTGLVGIHYVPPYFGTRAFLLNFVYG